MKDEMKWRVDADGILRFTLELGEEYANKFVCLTVASIEPPPDASPPSQEEGEKVSDDLGGKWVGDFPCIPRGKIMRLGADGVLRLPLGEINADKRVYVTLEILQPTAEAEAQQRAERRRFIEEMAGIITDPTFVRHPQGEFEKRDEL
jgi:hypothetical protein